MKIILGTITLVVLVVALLTGCDGKVCPEGEELVITGYITTTTGGRYPTTTTSPVYDCR